MIIPVRVVDAQGNVVNRNENVSYLELLKHISMSAMHFRPGPEKILRTLGTLLRYYHFLNPRIIRQNNCFGLPEMVDDRLYDPTEKAQFTTLVGKGLADLLAKRIYNANITFTYESVLRSRGPIPRGPRGDLLCIGMRNNRRRLFGVEAKGRSRFTEDARLRQITAWKDESVNWPIHTGFNVVSLAYDIYHDLKVDFVDPEPGPDKIEITIEDQNEMLEVHVNDVSKFFNHKTDIIEMEEFVLIPIDIMNFKENSRIEHFFEKRIPKIVISKQYLQEFKDYGKLLSYEPNKEKFIHQCRDKNIDASKDNFYIDRDGIGLFLP